jgi:Uncharacterized protein conserved in bacteria (DUF2125)
MKHWKLGSGLTFSAVLMGSTAFADITPEDLWAKYQELVAASGQTVTTESVGRNGDTLEIRGVTVTTADGTASVTQTIPEVNMKDNGDGTVDVTMSDTITVKGATPANPDVPGSPPGSVDMTITQSGLVMKAAGTLEAPVIDYSATSVSAKGAFDDGTGPTNLDMTFGSIVGGYALSTTEFQTNYLTGAGTINIVSPNSPVPVNISFGEMALDLKFPISKTDAAVPFTFLMKLGEFSLPPEIWAMADPTGQLPQDPATLVIDTTGMIRLLADFNATPAAGEVPPPPEVSAVSIKELRLKMVGAELTGSGDLTLDNTDLVTFAGTPAPTGVLNFTLTGGNGLLDKLAAMGVVPEDQLMGVRMMMGMFASPAADGSDTLNSVVEFKDKGLFVNGQQLQ